MPQITQLSHEYPHINLGNGSEGQLEFCNGNKSFYFKGTDSSHIIKPTLSIKQTRTHIFTGIAAEHSRQACWDRNFFWTWSSDDNGVFLEFYNLMERKKKHVRVQGQFDSLLLLSETTGLMEVQGETHYFEITEHGRLDNDIDIDCDYDNPEKLVSIGCHYVELTKSKHNFITGWNSETVPLDVSAHRRIAEYYLVANSNCVIRFPLKEDDINLFTMFYFDENGMKEIDLTSMFPSFRTFKRKKAEFYLIKFSESEKTLQLLMSYPTSTCPSQILTITDKSFNFFPCNVPCPIFIPVQPFSANFSVFDRPQYVLKMFENELCDIGELSWHDAQLPFIQDIGQMMLAYDNCLCFNSPAGVLAMDFAAKQVMYVAREATETRSSIANIIRKPTSTLRLGRKKYFTSYKPELSHLFSCRADIDYRFRAFVDEEHVIYVTDDDMWKMMNVCTKEVEIITDIEVVGQLFFYSRDKVVFKYDDMLLTVNRTREGLWIKEITDYRVPEHRKFVPNLDDLQIYYIFNTGTLINRSKNARVQLNTVKSDDVFFLDHNTIALPDGVYTYNDDVELTQLIEFDLKNYILRAKNTYWGYSCDETDAVTINSATIVFLNGKWSIIEESYNLGQFLCEATYVQPKYNPFTGEGLCLDLVHFE
ncbi:hypothetical protein PCE1_002234 [Barthelona sp. PCE]